jgi:hypothetical protein
MGAAVSLVAITVGAILRFATNVQSNTWDVGALGDIIMIAGIIGLVVSVVSHLYWERTSVHSYLRRQTSPVVDGVGVVHGPTGYARTSYPASYPNLGAVPIAVPVVPGSGSVVEETEERSASI